MDDFEKQLHRTLVQFLIDSDNPELAAAMIDGGVNLLRYEDGRPYAMHVDVPTSAYSLVSGNPLLKQSLLKAGKTVATGYIYDHNDVPMSDPEVKLRVKLVEVERGWQAVAREMIVNAKGSNQGVVSKLMAARQGKETLTYNEATYASQTEIRIAMELEERQVLFFPLPLAIRADTGEFYRDHREPDFLVCHEGTWGILEVSYHPDRYEKDKEKDAWFKKSGILCVEHYTAERCFKDTSRVIDEFLTILSKHKRL
jgi:hypothetical protein